MTLGVSGQSWVAGRLWAEPGRWASLGRAGLLGVSGQSRVAGRLWAEPGRWASLGRAGTLGVSGAVTLGVSGPALTPHSPPGSGAQEPRKELGLQLCRVPLGAVSTAKKRGPLRGAPGHALLTRWHLSCSLP